MPMVGEMLAGRYRIDAALGAGATAVVYRARDLRLERDVAIKVLLPNLARDPLVAGRFDREARALAAAAHPGIVAVYDVDRGDPAVGREPFFVMELCDGGSLADALDAAGGRLPPDILVPLLATIAGGIASLHARAVIHRDVKPHNILLCGGGAKLGDFGLARAQDTTRLTAAGTGAGTLAYLAPELLGGDEPGPAADVYGLGVVAFQGLAGRLPRPSGSMVDLVDTRHSPVGPPSAVAPDLGRSFDGVIGAALSPDPLRRPSPMALGAGLTQALERWRTQQHPQSPAVGGGRPDASTQRFRIPGGGRSGRATGPRAGRRRSLLGPLIAASALGILAAIVILVLIQSGALFPGSVTSPSRQPSTSPSESASAGPTASETGSPSPSPSASSSPAPTATASPTAAPTEVPTTAITPPPTRAPTLPPIFDATQAGTQLANIYRGIQNAEDTGRVSGPNADELRRAADAVNQALQVGDRGQSAAVAARDLDQLVRDMSGDGRLSDTGEIRVTLASLRAALPPAS